MRGRLRSGPAIRLVFWLGAGLLALLPGAGPGLAQTAEAPLQSPVLTLDQDRFFADTLWGKRVEHELATASAALATENRRIEAELTAEEKNLTERRPNMTAEEFRKAADDFDARVVGIRSAQDAKTRALNGRTETERQEFLRVALPVISDVLRERGAVAILDNRAIIVAAGAIDITDTLVAEIDRRIGAGPAPEQPAPEQAAPAVPGTAPQTPTPSPAPSLAPGTTAPTTSAP